MRWNERLIGFLIERYAGNFPLWLAPEQVRVLPIGGEDEDNEDTRKVIDYAKSIHAELRAAGVRANIDLTSDPIKARIAHAEGMKTHTMLVLGKRDLDAGNVAIRIHGKGNLVAKPRGEVVAARQPRREPPRGFKVDVLIAIGERRP